MKFEPTDTEQREPVAYIDEEGSLVFKPEGHTNAVHISQIDGRISVKWKFSPKGDKAQHVFYPGDSVTITF